MFSSNLRHCVLFVLGLLLVATASASHASEQGPAPRVIVRFADSGKGDEVANERAQRAMQEVSARLGISLEHVRRLATGSELYRVRSSYAQDLRAEVAAEFRKNPNVVYAAPDKLMQPMSNDPDYNQQWHFFESTGGIRLPAAWNITSGNGVRVAVIDSGYRPHTDLAANIVGGYDFISDTFMANDGGGRDSNAQDPGDWVSFGACGLNSPQKDSSWHGTHVAGIVAAVTNNGTGVAGTAYGAKVVPIRVLGRCGASESDIAEAILWAVGEPVSGVPTNAHPAKVLNLSLGRFDDCDAGSDIQLAINTARAQGAVVVVSAGNEPLLNPGNATPAGCDGVTVVAATKRSGGRASYSSHGAVVDLAAPGGETGLSAGNGILSTFNAGDKTPGGDSYQFLQGTSMAAPQVAGVAALMLSVNSALDPADVEDILEDSARSFPASCSGCGAGIVNALAALNATLADSEPYDVNIAAQFFNCFGIASNYRLTWSARSGPSILEWDVDMQYSGSGTWTAVYNGTGTATIAPVSAQARFRARARNIHGWSSFDYTPYVDDVCGGGPL